MRRLLLSLGLALGLPLIALVSQADALPGLPRTPVTGAVQHNPANQVVRTVGHARHPQPSRDHRAQRRRQQHRNLVARWQGVADCESGGNWRANTGNGYYGGLQFSQQTWRAYGGPGMPHEQPAWKQSQIAERVRADQGLGAWPNCGRYYRG